jgi:hypothetical protein
LAYYKGGGYCERQSLAELRRSELRRLRREHFTTGQRLLFGLAWSATLPRLRLALLRRRAFSRSYHRLRNWYYRYGPL